MINSCAVRDGSRRVSGGTPSESRRRNSDSLCHGSPRCLRSARGFPSETAMRDIQALLDSGFTKLRVAEAEFDHGARWDVPGLRPLEKVAILLNDLFCEADRGGVDYWLQRGYAARGKVELQRRLAAVVELHYDLDPVAAEVILAMM